MLHVKSEREEKPKTESSKKTQQNDSTRENEKEKKKTEVKENAIAETKLIMTEVYEDSEFEEQDQEAQNLHTEQSENLMVETHHVLCEYEGTKYYKSGRTVLAKTPDGKTQLAKTVLSIEVINTKSGEKEYLPIDKQSEKETKRQRTPNEIRAAGTGEFEDEDLVWLQIEGTKVESKDKEVSLTQTNQRKRKRKKKKTKPPLLTSKVSFRPRLKGGMCNLYAEALTRNSGCHSGELTKDQSSGGCDLKGQKCSSQQNQERPDRGVKKEQHEADEEQDKERPDRGRNSESGFHSGELKNAGALTRNSGCHSGELTKDQSSGGCDLKGQKCSSQQNQERPDRGVKKEQHEADEEQDKERPDRGVKKEQLLYGVCGLKESIGAIANEIETNHTSVTVGVDGFENSSFDSKDQKPRTNENRRIQADLRKYKEQSKLDEKSHRSHEMVRMTAKEKKKRRGGRNTCVLAKPKGGSEPDSKTSLSLMF